jgi:hypothetical protein
MEVLNKAISSLSVVGTPFNVKHKAHITYEPDAGFVVRLPISSVVPVDV